MAAPGGIQSESQDSILLRDFISAADAGVSTGALPACLRWLQAHPEGPASGIPRFLSEPVLAFRDGARLLEVPLLHRAAHAGCPAVPRLATLKPRTLVAVLHCVRLKAPLFKRDDLVYLASLALHSPDTDSLAKSASALLLYDLGDPARGSWALAASAPELPPLPSFAAEQHTGENAPVLEAGGGDAGPQTGADDAAAAGRPAQAGLELAEGASGDDLRHGDGGGASAGAPAEAGAADSALAARVAGLAQELAALDPERTGAALPPGLVAFLTETAWSADTLGALGLDSVKDAVTLLLVSELASRDLGLSRSAGLLAALLLAKLRAVAAGAPRALTEAALLAARLRPGPVEAGVLRPLVAEPLSAGLGDLAAKMVAVLPQAQQARGGSSLRLARSLGGLIARLLCASVLSALCAPAVARRWGEAEVAVAQAVVSPGAAGDQQQLSRGLSPEDFAQLVSGLEAAAPGLAKSVKFAKLVLSVITSNPQLAAEWKESMRDVVRSTSSFMVKSLMAKVEAL